MKETIIGSSSAQNLVSRGQNIREEISPMGTPYPGKIRFTQDIIQYKKWERKLLNGYNLISESKHHLYRAMLSLF